MYTLSPNCNAVLELHACDVYISVYVTYYKVCCPPAITYSSGVGYHFFFIVSRFYQNPQKVSKESSHAFFLRPSVPKSLYHKRADS